MLSGCASNRPPQTLTRTERVKVLPPVTLVQDTPAPLEKLDTNGGLVETIIGYRKALGDANRDKRALREWARKEEAK